MSRSNLRRIGTLILCAFVGCVPILSVAAAESSEPPEEILEIGSSNRLPGVGIAEGITQVTGVAISPLLGVSGVGVWQYFRTPEDLRDQLPWFCHPVAWGIGMGILSLCVIKDVFGPALPTFLKKPLDLLEVFEDKLSAVLAGSAFVPFLASQIALHFGESYAGPHAASTLADSPWLLASSAPFVVGQVGVTLLLIPVLLAGFGVVWLMSHAFTVLIMLSPFGLLDSLLKLARLTFLGFLAILSFLSPVLAAILSLLVVGVAIWLAPRAFRLCVFGTVMSVDFLRSLVRKSKQPEATRGFLARQGSDSVQVRCYGTLQENDGRITFESKRLFLGPGRNLKLPEEVKIQKGFLFPSIVTEKGKGFGSLELIHLLPSHRHHVDAIAEQLEITDVLDPPSLRGVKAMKAWLKSMWQVFQREPEIPAC